MKRQQGRWLAACLAALSAALLSACGPGESLEPGFRGLTAPPGSEQQESLTPRQALERIQTAMAAVESYRMATSLTYPDGRDVGASAAWAAPDAWHTSTGAPGEGWERMYIGDAAVIRSNGPDEPWVEASAHGPRGVPSELIPDFDDIRFVDSPGPGFYALQATCDVEYTMRVLPGQDWEAPTFLVHETHTLVIDEQTHLLAEMSSEVEGGVRGIFRPPCSGTLPREGTSRQTRSFDYDSPVNIVMPATVHPAPTATPPPMPSDQVPTATPAPRTPADGEGPPPSTSPDGTAWYLPPDSIISRQWMPPDGKEVPEPPPPGIEPTPTATAQPGH